MKSQRQCDGDNEVKEMDVSSYQGNMGRNEELYSLKDQVVALETFCDSLACFCSQHLKVWIIVRSPLRPTGRKLKIKMKQCYCTHYI